ncbi:MAG: leucyl/phenylalanyl-tRNA--protein transferase [Prevotella sp.]|nr:leucyl/phenylalanyl-tRNA--protein transferase [Prevotella sp.]
MVFQLDDTITFPDPHYGEPDGLLAVGGDLSVDRLLLAYSNGIFPWFSFRDCEEPQWYCPMQRFVIFPDEIHISHSMRTLLNKGRYEVSINQDFEGVIRQCSLLRADEPGAWLGEDMIEAYTELHRQHFAASVEVWDPIADGNDSEGPTHRLVGGLYGVNICKAFFGESMFSLVPSASKLALIFLAQVLKENGGTLIDCQFETPHLRSMGGRHISYDEYMQLLNS